ncbi:MAG: outer membrane protein assembly factor [Bacteroidaceae bacterium]|nr:outer membrane protein assembly factor [Bacteroidaceae bacterium]
MTLILITIGVGLFASCSSTQLAEGEHYLGSVSVESEDPSVSTSQFLPYLRQTSSKSLLSKLSKKGRKNIFDVQEAEASRRDFKAILNNNGYMQAVVNLDTVVNEKGKMDVTYKLQPGKQLFVGAFEVFVEDEHMDSLLRKNDILPHSSLFETKPFNATALNSERKRITDYLLEKGYSRFNKEFITVDADTMEGENQVWMTMKIEKFRANSRMEPTNHPQYSIGNITYKTLHAKHSPLNADSIYADKQVFRKSVLEENTLFEEKMLFKYSDLQQTYNRFGRLGALRSTQIVLSERPDTNIIDAVIHLQPNLVNSISFMPEGTNTAGNLGAAASLTYSNRNVFRGSETFSMQLRGAYEAIHGLEGYSDSEYREFGSEAKLEFPRLLAPFINRNFRRRQLASSELSLSYNTQNRPEFHRRVLRSTWRYRWQSASKSHSYVFDLLDLNFISMPWISETFKETYLESGSKRNAILKYNYEDLFIMKIGMSMSFKGRSQAFRVGVETAGNILSGFGKLTNARINENGQRVMFGNAYAQYAKFDFDYTKILPLRPKTDLALHTDFGVAYPYGNSKILPFEKRYFSGGANSVRGWSVRELGPGRFRSTDGAIDFINQTGDMKIDLNAELRGPLFWKLNYALFVDAGNLWTLRNYEDQPGGKFRINHFLEEMAVGYGAGVRFNFDYFILRFDCGMKAINPAYETNEEHWAIIHPKLSRDFTFHFAVGLPF